MIPGPAVLRRPKFDVEEIREHVATVHHKAIDELSGEIAILKKNLRTKRVPEEVLRGTRFPLPRQRTTLADRVLEDREAARTVLSSPFCSYAGTLFFRPKTMRFAARAERVPDQETRNHQSAHLKRGL
jgi:hypothetical protein